MSRIERIEQSNREGWLRARGRDVTASQVGALWGVHDYTTPLELYHQKRRSLPPEGKSGENPAMRRGRIFERAAVDMIAEDHPKWVIDYNAELFTYFRDPETRLGATPDLIVQCPERGKGVVQIKTVGRRHYRAAWLDEDGEYSPPLWILLQAELERHLTGGVWAAVAPLVVGDSFEIEIPVIEVPETPGLIDTMAARAKTFWENVTAGIEPQPDYERDHALIDRLNARADQHHELDLTGDERVGELLRARAEAQATRKVANDQLDKIDAEIKHKMGSAAVAHVGEGKRIIWRNERREGRFTEPSNNRVLRAPKFHGD